MSMGFCKTNGRGFWSKAEKSVPVEGLELRHVDRDIKLGELVVYFDTSVWNIEKLGLIYTDPQWIEDFKNLLIKFGFSETAANDLHYSTPGMQRPNYVSIDVKQEFLREAMSNFRDIVRLNVNKY